MNAALAVAVLAIWLWGFWGLYVLVMGLYRAHLDRRLGPLTKVLALPFIGLGFVVDVVSNLTIAALLFLELPREWLVTDRLQRHVHTGRGWRFHVAFWVCEHVLDPFDPTGSHC